MQSSKKRSSKISSEALPRLARLFKIVTYVASPLAGQPLSRKELGDLCGCDIRTIQRDLTLLAEAGIPIDYDRRYRTYRLVEKGWIFPTASLRSQDTLALAFLRGMVGSPGFPQGEALRETLDRLTGSLPPGLSALIEEAAHGMHWGTSVRDYSQAPLAELQEAARSRKTIELDYMSRSQSVRSWRCVDPYVVEAREGQFWELHGWCHRNAAIRTFALDQMQGMRETGTVFAVREAEWEAFSSVRNVIGGIRGGECVPVDVVFLPPVAIYARDYRWPPGLTTSSDTAGTVRLTGTVSGLSGLVPELLRWRRYCRVVGGPELKARMAEEVHAMAALYADEY